MRENSFFHHQTLSLQKMLHAVSQLCSPWKGFSFHFIVRRIRHLNFYSCDNRDSILFVKSVVFPTRKALFRGFPPIIGANKISEKKRFSASLYRCFSFVIYANELYMRSVRMLRIILPFLLSCNNELLFCLNTAYGKDFMAFKQYGKWRNFLCLLNISTSKIWRARQTIFRWWGSECHGTGGWNRDAQMHSKKQRKQNSKTFGFIIDTIS